MTTKRDLRIDNLFKTVGILSTVFLAALRDKVAGNMSRAGKLHHKIWIGATLDVQRQLTQIAPGII
ncbi:hypothetical protein EPYR_03851 [Erwinia pyrifoliae DSM 12163]|nr:hypothetical protein EPYR_03851 [Erwinia pyrifoliae DSM 12163]